MSGKARAWLGGAIFLVLLLAAGKLLLPNSNRPPSIPNAIQPNDLLNAADPKQGALTFKGCAACHNGLKDGPKPGGPKLVGPSLWGIVGAPIASQRNFPYSDALLKHKAKYWTTDELYEWLRDPSSYAPGTYMNFGGLLDPQDRMDLIAYLITLK